MNWKIPPQKVFFVPVPYTGQNLMELVEYKFREDKQPKEIDINDPEKGKTRCRILDYLGAYEFYKIPDFISRLVTDKPEMTGEILTALLRKKRPEFGYAKKILFYQITK